MKLSIKLFSVLFLLVTVTNSFAQEEKKTYYDKNWKVVSNESKAEYYRLVTLDEDGKPVGNTKDYFITGELQWEGRMSYIDESDNSKDISEGLCTWYHKNGQKGRQSIMIADKEDGLTTFWYDKGQIKAEIEYKLGVLNGKYIEYYENGKTKFKAEYKDGKIVGQWGIDCDEFDKCQKIFSDRFMSGTDDNDWGEADKENYTSEIIAGKGFLMRNKTDKGFAQWIHLPIDISNNFSIETVMDFKGGSANTGQGLIYGYKDWNNYYYFYISSNGQYRIGGVTDGINIQFANWTPSRTINQGKQRNLIKVNKMGSKVYFSINGQIVETSDFYSFTGNNVGFSIPSGDKEVLFERLVVRQDIGANNSSSEGSSGSEWKASASGFLIDTKGYIVTNYHVVDDANKIQVELTTGGQKLLYNAKVISVDKQNDLAVIKIDDSSYKPVPKLLYNFKLGISDVGTNVFCLGYPMSNIMGEEVKFTDGKISAKTGYQGSITTYQISVPVQHGNSGCPLFDYDGNLIGVVSSGITEADNVGYAIKSGYLNSLLEVLPESVAMPTDVSLATKPLTEKIKVLSQYVVLIKIK